MRTLVVTTLLALAVKANAEPNSTQQAAVSDEKYGVALYQLYQQNYQQALTEFAIADAKGGIDHPGVDAQVVKAGAAFSYGLHMTAARDFNALLSEQDQDLLNYAKLQLARVYFANNDAKLAQQTLSEITPPTKDIAWHNTFYYLQGRLGLALSNPAQANTALSQLPVGRQSHHYLAHNILVGSPSNQDAALALLTLPELDQEQHALLDRSFLALGYAALENDQATHAEQAFSQVSQQSLWFNEALYGLAASLLMQQQYAKALAALNVIIESTSGDVFAKHQALTAKAHVFVSTERFALAVDAIDAAEQQFVAFNTRLDAVNKQVNNTAWLRDTLQNDTALKGYMDILHVGLLSDDFDAKRHALFELTELASQFNVQQRQLTNYAALLQEKAARQNRIIQATNLPNYLSDLRQQQQQLQVLQASLNKAKNTRSGLLNKTELQAQKRILSAQHKIDSLKSSRNIASQQARLERLKGILVWQQDYQFDERYQAHKQQLAQAQLMLDKAQSQYNNSQALIESQRDFNALNERLAKTQQQLALNQQSVNTLINKQVAEIQQLLLDDLKASSQFLADDQFKLKVMRSIALEALAMQVDSSKGDAL
ncbi:hypothetical protein [Pseudoalteromonas spongiae]|uniref:hypothetical protein n=1 Tax=Pseudoalteromonas spongiae TaxID=298657 RepID=UPI00026C9510|nr:hypothetical protein [Pseudoalteromonas spongiae]ATC99221.1 hypothetical protein PSPO_a2249 [Pseudoalteromonas spongiae UST010723-006]